jgi:hypothetical protein
MLGQKAETRGREKTPLCSRFIFTLTCSNLQSQSSLNAGICHLTHRNHWEPFFCFAKHKKVAKVPLHSFTKLNGEKSYANDGKRAGDD